MTDKSDWEEVTYDIRRLKINNGYIYHYFNLGHNHAAICFVPNCADFTNQTEIAPITPCETVDNLMAPYQDLLNKVGDLSMKLNKMQSDLREFERERVNPKFDECKKHIDSVSHRKDEDFIKVNRRIDELTGFIRDLPNKHQSLIANHFLSLSERIEKLESTLQNLKEVMNSHDCRLNDIFNRIERLEKLNVNSTDHENSNAGRISKLESRKEDK